MKRLLQVILTVLVALPVILGIHSGAYAASEGSITSYANAQRAAAGASALKSDATMNAVALNAAKRYAAGGAINKGENLASQIPAGWTGTQTVRQMMTTTDPGAVYAKALSGHQTAMNGKQWTAMGSGFATARGQIYLVLLYATYPPPAPVAPPVRVDPAPAPAPAPVRTAAPAPVRTVAPAPDPVASAPARKPAPIPAPQPSKAPSRAPAPSKKAAPTPAQAKAAKPSQGPAAAPEEPTESPKATVITQVVNSSGLTGEDRHTLSGFMFAGAGLAGTVSTLSWLVARQLSKRT